MTIVLYINRFQSPFALAFEGTQCFDCDSINIYNRDKVTVKATLSFEFVQLEIIFF